MDRERKCLLSARLRNLERKYAKLSQHPELLDETFEVKRELDKVKHELNS